MSALLFAALLLMSDSNFRHSQTEQMAAVAATADDDRTIGEVA